MRHKQLPTKQSRHKSVTFIGGGQTTFSQESSDTAVAHQSQMVADQVMAAASDSHEPIDYTDDFPTLDTADEYAPLESTEDYALESPSTGHLDVMRLAFLENNDCQANDLDYNSPDFARILQRNIQMQMQLQQERRILIQFMQQSCNSNNNNTNNNNISNNNSINNITDDNIDLHDNLSNSNNNTSNNANFNKSINNINLINNNQHQPHQNNRQQHQQQIPSHQTHRQPTIPRQQASRQQPSRQQLQLQRNLTNQEQQQHSLNALSATSTPTPTPSKSHNTSVKSQNTSVASNASSFHCDEPGCGKSFPSLRKLKHHKVVHSDDFPFVCAFQGCNKKFKRKFGIDLHSTTHFDLDPDMYAKTSNNSSLPFFGRRMQYSMCKPCGQKFKTVHEYQNHMLKHGKEPFKCPVKGCGQSFTIWKSFQKHRASHYFNYYCRMDRRCKHSTSNLQLLKLHIYCCHFQRTLPDNATLTASDQLHDEPDPVDDDIRDNEIGHDLELDSEFEESMDQ